MQHLTLNSKFNIYEIQNTYQFYVYADTLKNLYSLIKNRKYILPHNRNSFIYFNE